MFQALLSREWAETRIDPSEYRDQRQMKEVWAPGVGIDEDAAPQRLPSEAGEYQRAQPVEHGLARPEEHRVAAFSPAQREPPAALEDR